MKSIDYLSSAINEQPTLLCKFNKLMELITKENLFVLKNRYKVDVLQLTYKDNTNNHYIWLPRFSFETNNEDIITGGVTEIIAEIKKYFTVEINSLSHPQDYIVCIDDVIDLCSISLNRATNKLRYEMFNQGHTGVLEQCTFVSVRITDLFTNEEYYVGTEQ